MTQQEKDQIVRELKLEILKLIREEFANNKEALQVENNRAFKFYIDSMEKMQGILKQFGMFMTVDGEVKKK